MGGQRAGLIGLAVAAIIVATAIGFAGGPFLGPAASLPPSPAPAVGPVVFYEILGATSSRLLERRLDGRSLPRVVGERSDVEYGRTWIVDPDGTLAVAVVPGRDDQLLAAIAVATAQPLWEARTPIAPADAAIWSADGGRFALVTVGTELEARRALIVDSSTGVFVSAAVPEDAILQAFDRNGGLILRQRVPGPPEAAPAWRFLRFDPGSSIVEALVGLPDVGPASEGSEDVAPGAAIGIDTAFDDGEGKVVVRLWPLGGGAARNLATFPSIDRVAIDPSGAGVAVSLAQTIGLVGFDGRTRDIFRGDDPIADFGWSAGGDYLAVAVDRPGANLTVVERATGRSVAIPQRDAVAQALFVRIVGGVPLPEAPLPALEPAPTPTPAPSGGDVAGFPELLSSWTETIEGGGRVVHLERLVPTEAGGMRIAATMPPIELGAGAADGEDPGILSVLPRPHGGDVLVWVRTAEGSRGWLWDGAAGRTPLALPPDWPADAYDLAWRPDGKALAASAAQATDRGDVVGTFVIAGLGSTRTTVVPLVGDYDRLEGWWSPTELRVGHGICTEGCGGRYSYSARLRIADRRLVQLTPADRGTQAVDLVTWDDSALVLTMINEETSDDLRIDWPAELGTAESSDVLGFASDGRTLLLSRSLGDGTEIVAVDDPAGRAVDGRLGDPRPTTLGRLPGRSLQLELSADRDWLVATDRVEDVHLVRLVDGRSWPLDRDRHLLWP
jgi:hypothetical protein